MNVARFIARRYFKSKKSKNVINLITMISVVGIAISTAALVILLSAFNGIEQMVVKLYSDFDPPITIQSAKAKTFNQHFLDVEKIKEVKGVTQTSRVVEEVVILKKRDKWVHANMLGVDTNFVSMSKMEEHLIDGRAVLNDGGAPLAIFGAVLLDKLDGYVPASMDFKEQITFNVPLREGKLRPGKNPLNIRAIDVGARINYNREVNNDIVVISYDVANDLLEYGDDITALYVNVEKKTDVNKIKKTIQNIVGTDFEVKTSYEKNELIFKTSKTERLIVYFILVFIFILASFNLIASIAMLFIEKKEDITTLLSFGADKKMIFNIYFYEGMYIVGQGVIIGLIIGYGVVFLQILFGLVEMPNVPGEFFPISPTWKDAFGILASVTLLGILVCYFPTKVLVRKHPGLNMM